MYSIVIPVYRNEESIPDLLNLLNQLWHDIQETFHRETEVVFVVDGSPDDSFTVLQNSLARAPFKSQLLLHSRNFGSFAAIRSGLAAAGGDLCAVMAADLQDPPELIMEFFRQLELRDSDIAVGVRSDRSDPLFSRMAAATFWKCYRTFVNSSIPASGVDVFACNRRFRMALLQLEEANSSLIGLIYWLGFRRVDVPYVRRQRKHGRSAWSLRRKLDYLLDSVFSFTDLPVRALTALGLAGMLVAAVFGTFVFLAKVFGGTPIAGYASTFVGLTFFGGLNAFGLGIVGSYAWRGYENTKARPLSVVMHRMAFNPKESVDHTEAQKTVGSAMEGGNHAA